MDEVLNIRVARDVATPLPIFVRSSVLFAWVAVMGVRLLGLVPRWESAP